MAVALQPKSQLLSSPRYMMPSPFRCLGGGANFDGTNDYLKLGTDMASNADATQGIFSIWLTFESTASIQRILYANIEKTIIIERTAAGNFQVTLKNAAGTSSLVFTGTTIYGAGGGPVNSNQRFVHVAMAWDTNYSAGNKKCAIYLDGAAETLTKTDTSPAFTIKYTGSQHGFMADVNDGSAKWNGSVGCIYYNNAEFLDLSVAANLAKLRQIYKGNGFPAYMRGDGSAVTGTRPIVFFNNSSDTFQTNLGYGGGYTLLGALVAASPTNPCLLPVGGVISIPD